MSETSRAVVQGYENWQKVVLNNIKNICFLQNLKPSKKEIMLDFLFQELT